jgi:regulator of cell morphogenesis and NO signaling
MERLNLDRTLGDLVTENPARANVLEALDLDFCCGGDQPLAAACLAAGLDPATVARLLERMPAASPGETPGPDLQRLSLTELADHIEQTHHVFMKRALPRLAQLAAKVSAAHGAGHPELPAMQDVLADLTAEIELHLDKEERILFPAIRALESTRGAAEFHCGMIQVMELEHDQAGAALERLRSLSRGYALPADACETYRAYFQELQALERDLHRHIHKENSVLFPRTLELSSFLLAGGPGRY